MIKTEHEYTEAKKRVEKEFQAIEEQGERMRKAQLTEEQIHLALDPLASFAFQLKEEVEEYEKIKRGEFPVIENLEGIGRILVAIRISKGIKQKDLAERLKVKEAQVSRDERNEYHGASIQKIQGVLEALGVNLKSKVQGIYNR